MVTDSGKPDNTELRVRPRRLVVVGSVLADIQLTVPHLPERGGDVLANAATITAGGGFNLLAAAVRTGLPAAYGGVVGDGSFGHQVLGDLAALQVPSLLAPAHGADTGFDIALVEADGERTFITFPGVESRLTEAQLAKLPLEAGDAVYVSGYDLCYPTSGSSLQNWLPTLDDSLLVIFDPGPLVGEIPPSTLAAVLRRSDIVSLNHREARLLGAPDSGEGGAAAREITAMTHTDAWTVLRCGADGCWLARGGDTPLHVPARPTEALDTTGAGDTHVAVMLSRLAAGDEMILGARWANVAASLSVEQIGPATCPTAEQLAAEMRRLHPGFLA